MTPDPEDAGRREDAGLDGDGDPGAGSRDDRPETSVAVVVSEADPASRQIGTCLRSLVDWEVRVDDDRPAERGGGEYRVAPGLEMRRFEALHLYTEDAAAPFADPDVLAFASKHSGETGPLLTAHFTGNFGPAEYGGRPGELATAAPGALDRVRSTFERVAPGGYEAGIEATHHGPSSVGCPSLFVEVGSDEPQWHDEAAARAAARAILALRDADPGSDRAVVGLGGGHYAPRFDRILRETDWTVGHVAADWALEDLRGSATDGDPSETDPEDGNPDDAGATAEIGPDDLGPIRRAFERSGTDLAVVDGDRTDLRDAVEAAGYRVVSETWLRAVDGRPRELVRAVEDRLGPVEDGVRFGDRVPEVDDERPRSAGSDPRSGSGANSDRGAEPGASGEFAVVDLPAGLVAEAQGIDPAAIRRAVERRAVAFDTRDGASRVDGEGAVALPAREARSLYDDLVAALAGVLDGSYDGVDYDREAGAVVATETAFDPDLAREAGVPEGPAFGRLSSGQSVEVDGRTVDPDAVHRERTRRFHVDSDPVDFDPVDSDAAGE